MKFLANLTLRTKITLFTALGILLGVSVFSFLGIRAVNQSTQAMLQDRLTTARIVANYVDETLGNALYALETTTRLIAADPLEDNLPLYLEELMETYLRLSIYPQDTYLLDEQGRIIWTTQQTGGTENVEFSAYPAVSRAINQGEAGISGMVWASGTDVPVVLLVSPLRGQQTDNWRAIAVAIDLSRSGIGGFIRQIRLGNTGYVEIIDESGTVIARTEPGPRLAPFEKSDHSGRFADLIATGEPARGLCHTCHEPTAKVSRKDMLAFVPLSEVRWGVVIRQSEEEALAPVYALRQNLIIFDVFLVVLGFLFVAVTSRDIVGRIKVLTLASRKIAGGDLASPVTPLGEDEVGKLSRTFDDMRLKLKDSHAALERKTGELASLLSISEILTSLSGLISLHTTLGNALDKTLEIMDLNVGGILLLDAEKQLLTYQAQRGLHRKKIPPVSCRLDEGITGRAARSGEIILVADISTDHRAVYADTLNSGPLKSFISVPLSSQGGVLGVMNIASPDRLAFTPADIKLLHSIAAQISNAIDNAGLHREIQHKEKVRGELLREILSIQERERKRIARELHDETSQSLASLAANLEAMTGMLPAGTEKIRTRIKKTQDLSISILDEINKLIYELRPSLLDDLGLVAAARWLAENNLETAGIKVDFKTVGKEKRLPSQLETTLFRVIQEAVTNITRHAGAKNTSINLQFKRSLIRVSIKDDGKGFDVEEAITSRDRPRGLGLLGMKERVELVKGTLKLRSRTGYGTQISIEIPLKQAVDDG